MGKKTKITIDLIVIYIGICCIGAGLGIAVGYLFGYNNVSKLIGDVPMSFATAVCIFFIGIALYLIGKFRLHHDESIR